MPGANDNGGQGSRPIRGEPYRGRYRVNPDRTVDMWNGNGYGPRTTSTIAPEAAQALQRERTELERLTGAATLGGRFLEMNRRQATGSIVRRIPGLNDLMTTNNATLQQMENLQNSRVFEYMRGGAAGGGISPQVANTPQEQGRLERTGPTISNTGPANRGIVLGIQIDRDLQRVRLDAMERWARDPQRRSLDGFTQWWALNEPRIRADIQRRYEQTNGPVGNQADAFGRQRPNPPERPPNVPSNYVWDPDRERWTPNAR